MEGYEPLDVRLARKKAKEIADAKEKWFSSTGWKNLAFGVPAQAARVVRIVDAVGGEEAIHEAPVLTDLVAAELGISAREVCADLGLDYQQQVQPGLRNLSGHKSWDRAQTMSLDSTGLEGTCVHSCLLERAERVDAGNAANVSMVDRTQVGSFWGHASPVLTLH